MPATAYCSSIAPFFVKQQLGADKANSMHFLSQTVAQVWYLAHNSCYSTPNGTASKP